MRGRKLAIISLIALGTIGARAQQTVGMFTHTGRSLDSGYVLFSPIDFTTTYLIDKCGRLMHTWPSTHRTNNSVYLLADGSVLRPGYAYNENRDAGGIVERISWDGNVTWSYVIADSIYKQHHDIRPLPNGNVLVVAREVHSPDEVAAAGRNTANVPSSPFWSEEIMELQPTGPTTANVVWRWRVWDHLVQSFDQNQPNYGVVADHPELIDINFPRNSASQDWLHMNAVSYNAALDEIMVSAHNFSEIWIIDHSTNASEASTHFGGRRGKGGDLLYRWGNPQAYGHGTAAQRSFYGQHGTDWIPAGSPHAGKIIVFNNGISRPQGPYSSIEIIDPPVDANGGYDMNVLPMLPTTQDWVYTATPPSALYTPLAGSGMELSNGNVIICEGGTGTLSEIDASKNIAWRYVSPVGTSGPVWQGQQPVSPSVFRCTFYPWSYAAFAGRSLGGGPTIEVGGMTAGCSLNVGTSDVAAATVFADAPMLVFPNPTRDRIAVGAVDDVRSIAMYNSIGQQVCSAENQAWISTATLPEGMYVMRVVAGNRVNVTSVAVVK